MSLRFAHVAEEVFPGIFSGAGNRPEITWAVWGQNSATKFATNGASFGQKRAFG